MSGARSAAWGWGVCGLLLLATMLNYMDRQTLSQLSTEICHELRLSNEDYGRLEEGFGYAFAAGGVVLGVISDRVSLRWLYPGVLLAWSAAGFATGWARGFESLMMCRVMLGFFEAGQWPCALTASQRLLPQRNRALGNSVLQSGAAIGAITTPLVVQAFVSDIPGSWRAPFRVIGVLGAVWIAVWFSVIRRGDLAKAAVDAPGKPETSTTTRSAFVRRFVVLMVVVVAINLCWHFYRAWMPKMLGEHYNYSKRAVNFFTSAFYVATDVGCLTAGAAARWLTARGWSVHRSRVVTFLACGLLTALSTVAATLPASGALLATLLVIAAGALGLFPIYYSLSQELSSAHQGKVTGALSCVAWVSSAVMQRQVGRWVDRTGSYTAILFGSGLLPLAALLVLLAFWDRPEKRALPEI